MIEAKRIRYTEDDYQPGDECTFLEEGMELRCRVVANNSGYEFVALTLCVIRQIREGRFGGATAGDVFSVDGRRGYEAYWSWRTSEHFRAEGRKS